MNGRRDTPHGLTMSSPQPVALELPVKLTGHCWHALPPVTLLKRPRLALQGTQLWFFIKLSPTVPGGHGEHVPLAEPPDPDGQNSESSVHEGSLGGGVRMRWLAQRVSNLVPKEIPMQTMPCDAPQPVALAYATNPAGHCWHVLPPVTLLKNPAVALQTTQLVFFRRFSPALPGRHGEHVPLAAPPDPGGQKSVSVRKARKGGGACLFCAWVYLIVRLCGCWLSSVCHMCVCMCVCVCMSACMCVRVCVHVLRACRLPTRLWDAYKQATSVATNASVAGGLTAAGRIGKGNRPGRALQALAGAWHAAVEACSCVARDAALVAAQVHPKGAWWADRACPACGPTEPVCAERRICARHRQTMEELMEKLGAISLA
jgi:hypothetical protein